MVANVEINPDGFYDQDAICRLLQIKAGMITKAVNAGELRCSVRGGRKWYRGSWLIDWLEGQDVKQELKASE